MTDLPTWRLNLLRAMYLLIVIGLGTLIWPLILTKAPPSELMRGVVWCLLGGVSILAAIGLRHPLKMLPLLFFEMSWKAIWLLAVALPIYRAGTMDATTMQTVMDCATAIIIPFVVPWRYVWATWIKAPAERWR